MKRRAAWIALAFAASSLGALERARAGAFEAMQALEPLATHLVGERDAARVIVVNGARIRLEARRERRALDAVLDDDAARCRAHGGAGEPLVDARARRQGFVGCFEPPRGASLLERLGAFAATGDAAALGTLRVAWATAQRQGTRYVALSSEGPLELQRIFPQDGDAPGLDLAGLPRPPEARRILTAWQDGAAPLLIGYRSERAPEVLERAYVEQLRAAGVSVERAPAHLHDVPSLLVRYGGHAALVLVAPDGGGTLLAIIPLEPDATEAPRAR